MNDLNLPATTFLFHLDERLRESGFTVWRNISWPAEAEVLIFGYKNIWFPYPMSISLFLAEFEHISANSIKIFANDCLKYVQRTVPKTSRAMWFRQYSYIPVLVSENISTDAVDFVSKIHRPQKNFFLMDYPFPVLINSQNKEIYYYRKHTYYGWLLNIFHQKLVDRLVVQNWHQN